MSSTLDLIGQLGTRKRELKKQLEEACDTNKVPIQEELDKVEKEISEALKKRAVEREQHRDEVREIYKRSAKSDKEPNIDL